MSPHAAFPVLLLGLALAPAGPPSAPAPFAVGVDGRVDSLLARWDREGSPGAAVAVMKDGELVLADGYGYAQLEHDAPITPDTVFHVASISKQVAAFAVCLLAADGKLDFQDPIRRHVPEVPDFGVEITLEHLLHHTSGLRDQWESLAIAGWRMDDVITTDHILTFVAHQRELNFAPGTQHMYCNTGYTLLAEAVARVSGQSFPEFCRERIFEPLGMENTHFHDDLARVVPQRAYSYAATRGGWANAVLSFANAGATSLFTTAVDLLLWLQNYSTGDVGGPRVQRWMRTRYVLADGTPGDYAYGVVVDRHEGHAALSHGGADAGFRSHAVWFPGLELGVVVLANAGQISTRDLAYAVANLFLEGAPVAPDPFATPLPAATAPEPGQVPAASPGESGRPADREPDAAALAACAGRYWSEELGTFYDLELEGDDLVARHRRHGTIRLTPIGPDLLRGDRWFFPVVELVRDADGRVTRFLVQGGRVRNMAFERRSPWWTTAPSAAARR